ncbi:DUF1800 domain-containing protein [Alloyangia pacifica]|uniref:DUF1800 domain-containing protein n=1 Tax=Alloyangia pacifica TaxID=311180 RepID=UPI001CFEB5E0|nr:DUF1800 domain-containing protein [Alloyangia pacifica]
MSYDPLLAEIRFGCGLSPVHAPPGSVQDMLERLAGPDHAAELWPIDGPEVLMDRQQSFAALQRQRREAKGDAAQLQRIAKDISALRKAGRAAQLRWFGQSLRRRIGSEDGFRERLAFFWGDHFTAMGRGAALKDGTSPYVEGAIRPHLAGRFADMLKAVTTSPLMLNYLDQASSMGPGSAAAARRKKPGAGLNENLARELMELHTLGAGGPYGQKDVTELAQLLTGFSFTHKQGFVFRTGYAEPGPETVLGRSYGGEDPARLDEVLALLEDLAAHPATAQHLSRKLAVHFVSDTPDLELVEAMAARYRETDGQLLAVYEAMLSHPAAWQGQGNVKPPVDFIGSSLRALAVAELPVDKRKHMERFFVRPLRMMGQTWETPDGPNGWPEEDASWVTPLALAARLQWALAIPGQVTGALPDPRQFLTAALGDRAPESLRFAAGAAEGRREGIALILASPSFQRM